MCECLTLEEIVDWQPNQEAIKRVPDNLKSHSFFGKLDLWQYMNISNPLTPICNTCLLLNDMVIQGDMMRAWFPNLLVITSNQVLPEQHPNCRCTMLRITDLSDYVDYTEPLGDASIEPYDDKRKMPGKIPADVMT